MGGGGGSGTIRLGGLSYILTPDRIVCGKGPIGERRATRDGCGWETRSLKNLTARGSGYAIKDSSVLDVHNEEWLVAAVNTPNSK